MKHKAGGKITSSHSSVTEIGSNIVSYLEKQKDVKKISLGVIKAFPGGRKSKGRVVKIVDEIGFIKIEATEGSSHQTLRVYLRDNLERPRVDFVERIKIWVLDQNWEFRYMDKR